MPLVSFTTWLEDRPLEVPDAGAVALRIAQSGTAGMSGGRVLQVSPVTLEILLRSLVTTGQVVVVQVGGEWRYRATM